MKGNKITHLHVAALKALPPPLPHYCCQTQQTHGCATKSALARVLVRLCCHPLLLGLVPFQEIVAVVILLVVGCVERRCFGGSLRVRV